MCSLRGGDFRNQFSVFGLQLTPQYEVLEIPVLNQPKIYLILRGELQPSNSNVADFLCMHMKI